MQHRVYRSISLGAPRDHHAIFVENENGGSGTVLQATGNIQTGMTFEIKRNHRPETSLHFFRKDYLGWVAAEDLHRVEQACAGIPPPKKQFDGPRRLFPDEPLRRCQEWTREAIDALVTGGILHPTS
ncbi:hypothetical protein LLEC1_06930 [Akanthomyces lecanii]|uniref:Uncharacterized protein n=1 Tax=Cordyceps confragosa TaxID=2714763 RepID=A0A179I331_CORDF|nr:hypothetical protein LLEC1_06930 [Akanthomyces lecanii]